MRVLGISAGNKESAVALVQSGQLRMALLQERVSRVHKDSAVPLAALRSVLTASGLTLDDIDAVAGNVSANQLRAAFGLAPRAAATLPRLPVGPLIGTSDGPEVHGLHHLSHAAFAYYTSGFERALVVTIDNSGDNDTLVAFAGEHGNLRRLQAIAPHPVPIGGVYEAVTRQLGFGEFGEGKLSGLAGYGTSDPVAAAELLAAVEPFAVSSAYLSNPHHPLQRLIRPAWLPWQQAHADLAATVQAAFETTILQLLQRLQQIYPCDNLCLGGGVALNCGLNGRIARDAGFARLYVPPSPGDPGNAAGIALLWAARSEQLLAGSEQVPARALPSASLGPAYPVAATAGWLHGLGLPFDDFSVSDPAGLAAAAASDLASAKVVGWFSGGSEFGPRALGHRSLLGDPRSIEVRNRLNDAKQRAHWRPVAPSIAAERANEWLLSAVDSPYMLIAMRARPHLLELAPAAVHIDGTVRAQTVHQQSNPAFHALLLAFAERTGLPLVLNTSFNQAGEPIVDSPQDALDCAQRCGLDVLYLDGLRVPLPPRQLQVAPPIDTKVAIIGEIAQGWRTELVRQTAIEVAQVLDQVLGQVLGQVRDGGGQSLHDPLCTGVLADPLPFALQFCASVTRPLHAKTTPSQQVLCTELPRPDSMTPAELAQCTLLLPWLGTAGMRALRLNLAPIRMGSASEIKLHMPGQPSLFDAQGLGTNLWQRHQQRLTEGLVGALWLLRSSQVTDVTVSGDFGHWHLRALTAGTRIEVRIDQSAQRPSVVVQAQRGSMSLDTHGELVLKVVRNGQPEVRRVHTGRDWTPFWQAVSQWRAGHPVTGIDPVLALTVADSVHSALVTWGQRHLSPRCQPPQTPPTPQAPQMPSAEQQRLVVPADEELAQQTRKQLQIQDFTLRLCAVASGLQAAASYENASTAAAQAVVDAAARLGLSAQVGQAYSAAWPAVRHDGPADRCTVHVAASARDLQALAADNLAYATATDAKQRSALARALGHSYGYPACCVQQFEVWQACALAAAYYPALALNTSAAFLALTNKRPPGAPLQHVPCSFGCTATAFRAEQTLTAALADVDRLRTLVLPLAAAAAFGDVTPADVEAFCGLARSPTAVAQALVACSAPLLYVDWRRYVVWLHGTAKVDGADRLRVQRGVAVPAAVLLGDAPSIAAAWRADPQLAALTTAAERQGVAAPQWTAEAVPQAWLLPFAGADS